METFKQQKSAWHISYIRMNILLVKQKYIKHIPLFSAHGSSIYIQKSVMYTVIILDYTHWIKAHECFMLYVYFGYDDL